LDEVTAAAVPVNYLTAAVALYKMANLAPGETVLVHGAGGGVGIAATQLAKLRRATVIGTASASKHDRLRELGVDHALDYRRADLSRDVRELTGNRGVDVVLDPIGGGSFRTSYQLLAPLGRLIIYGVSSIAPGERRSVWRALVTLAQMRSFKPLSLMNRNRGVFGLNLGHLWEERHQLRELMKPILDDMAAGRLRPIVARTFALEQAGEAHRYIQSRANIGKVVLTV
jgi:NADPH:quinone reductase-like Zn-dependent oxidoreductase